MRSCKDGREAAKSRNKADSKGQDFRASPPKPLSTAPKGCQESQIFMALETRVPGCVTLAQGLCLSEKEGDRGTHVQYTESTQCLLCHRHTHIDIIMSHLLTPPGATSLMAVRTVGSIHSSGDAADGNASWEDAIGAGLALSRRSL